MHIMGLIFTFYCAALNKQQISYCRQMDIVKICIFGNSPILCRQTLAKSSHITTNRQPNLVPLELIKKLFLSGLKIHTVPIQLLLCSPSHKELVSFFFNFEMVLFWIKTGNHHEKQVGD